MKYFIRMVNSSSNWSFDPVEDENFPAKPLADLPAKNDKLSFYEYDDQVNSIEDVIVGLASCKLHPDKIQYFEIDKQELIKMGYQLDSSSLGETCSEMTNKLHIDLINLTANSLVNLAKKLSTMEAKSYSKSNVIKAIQSAVREGIINVDCLKWQPDLKAKYLP